MWDILAAHRDRWPVDPLPTPPGDVGTTEYWRWASAQTLAATKGPYRYELICTDCGASDRFGLVHGFTSPIMPVSGEPRVYCPRCAARRGTRYLFDPRPWVQIEREDAGAERRE